ncbi:integrase [Arenibacter sp. N53]|uniref:tyrosine-type recombinase/integrase n=1 Tax=Arenibacter TaxID=178469 RepID=UPI000CD41EAD|nr:MULTISPECIES: tyrosine-type recombinase/integrase [Arenibacter]MCM4153603.1 integrase [Arenibacter sp. N53]
MTDPFDYQGVLAPYMKALIRIKESCGQTVIGTKWTYKEFDEFTIQYGLSEPIITKDLIGTWAKSRENDCSRTFYGKCSRLSQLAKYMKEHGIKSYIMPLPKCTNDRGFIPYIFSEEQMQSIFQESDRLLRQSRRKDDPIISVPCLIRLLYSTGLRITEAISLRNKDVDLDRNILKVGTWGSTKNGEERLVPICNTLKENLQKYLHYRSMLPVQDITDHDHPFFIKLNGEALSSANAYHWFKKVYGQCGIAYKGERFGPRVQDLRHTMATHSLAKMVREGLDIYAALPLLSASLGHKSLSSTEGYVRLTCSEYPELLEQCSSLNNFIYPKKHDNNE